MKTKLLCALAASGIAAAGPALAQDAYASTPWQGDFWKYVGVSAGQARFDADCGGAFACGKRDTGWKVYSGGDLNQFLGFEVGYTDFGSVAASGGDTKAWAANVGFTLGVPIAERFKVFAKAGGVYGRTNVSADPSTFSDTGQRSGWGSTYGVGGSFAISKQLLVRVDWDCDNLDFAGGRRDVDLASAGIAWRF